MIVVRLIALCVALCIMAPALVGQHWTIWGVVFVFLVMLFNPFRANG